MLTSMTQHDLPAENGVTRTLARKALRIVLPAMCLVACFAFGMLYEAVTTTIEAIWDTQDYGSVVASILVTLMLFYFVWINARQCGSILFGSFLSLDTPRKHMRDGVNSGPLEAKLTEDAIVWRYAKLHEEMHLSQFYHVSKGRRALILECCPAVRHFNLMENPTKWVATLRRNRKTAPKTGWPIPEASPTMHHFDLPKETYVAAKMRDDDGSCPDLSIMVLFISPLIFLGFLALVFFTLWSTSSEGYETIVYIGFALALIFHFVRNDLPLILRAYRRVSQGGTATGRDVTGLTHGATAYALDPKGITVYRRFYKQWICWTAIESADVEEDWISLKAADVTQATLPNTDTLREMMKTSGIRPPTGPWAHARAMQTWERDQ